MIKVLINSSSRFPVNRVRIKKLVKSVLGEHGVEKDIEVSILFAGDRKMKALNTKYRKIKETTDVLSFPLSENKFPDKVLRLGDIIISYPQVRKQAALYNILVDEEIDKLVKHGILSLLGLHN
ncbi:rRNA maturation RNase YbeY [Patescibacteria group bacterium]